MDKKPTYYFFYVLFSPDTWRIAIGVMAALWVGPRIFEPAMSFGARALVYVMITAIGWAASRVPALWICRALRRLVLGNRIPG